ncbi:MAG: EamA family transporter [Bryobacteraceae bacterium]
MTPRRWQADLALAGVAFIWGSTFVLVKQALDEVSTAFFIALRFGIAAIVLGLVYQVQGGRGHIRDAWTGGLLAGIFLFVGYLCKRWD